MRARSALKKRQGSASLRSVAPPTHTATRDTADPATVLAFGAGDPDAIGKIYQQFSGSVMAVACSILSDRDAAADVVQQTFLKAWRAADRFDTSRPLGPWLRTIARRTALDVIRENERRRAVPLSSAAEPATDPVRFDASLIAGHVRGALDLLPDDERIVVQLTHLDGLTHAEVARALDVPVGTVKSRSNRAHRRLAGHLRYLRDEGVMP